MSTGEGRSIHNAASEQWAPHLRDRAPLESFGDRLPVVGFHTHLQKRATAEDLIRRMDEFGVARRLKPLPGARIMWIRTESD